MAYTYATYHQATGLFQIFCSTHGEQESAVGYSGHGGGLNNPVAEAVAGIGPIPRGVYRVSPPYHHPSLGPLTYRLDRIGGEAFGRSAFRVHGDNKRRNRTASTGCIVLPRDARAALTRHGVKLLLVHTDDGALGLPEGIRP